MKEAVKKVRLDRIIQAVVMIVIGIVLIAWTKATLDIIARALAILIIAIGVVFVIGYFFTKEKTFLDSGSFAFGILIAAIGIWIFLNPGKFTDFIPRLFGIFILVSGLVNLGQTFELIRYKYSYWWVSLIFAIITIALGAVLLFNPTDIKEFTVKVIGAFLIYDGVSDIWTITRIGKFAKKAEQAIRDAAAVETVAEIVEESHRGSAEK